MFLIKTLTVKNFMSVGNATQAVNFDRQDLTLVLGENLDLGGDDSGARNGTGKTTIINALSYGLYGQALTNIKKDNLINKTNTKNMLVTIDFENNGTAYRIERGRKPGIMKFWVGDEEKVGATDDAQGDSRETQGEIERLLGMSHDMFRHVVALNTYTEPFLSLRANDQRTIIEQLLGITLLSEKADKLKELNKQTKDAIAQEDFRIKAVGDANKRIEEQIESLRRRQRLWQTKRTDDVSKLQAEVDELLKIDIDAEIESHRLLTEYNKNKVELDALVVKLTRACEDQVREENIIVKYKKEIETLRNHTCHTCGQDFHDVKHIAVLSSKESDLEKAKKIERDLSDHIVDLEGSFAIIGDLGEKPKVYYTREADAVHHRSTVANLQQNIAEKQNEQDPYTEQITEMSEKALEEISFDKMNELAQVQLHQEFLVKLLTNKDSFIRKRIIDQNLSYLNARLGQYLDRIGLPHTVKFNNDLTVSITELGRDLDFFNLSRGEMTRLIISLNLAFRDTWESLYHPINLLFIDELLDSGLDGSGIENTLAILKKMSRELNKSIWLVSHKDELVSRVSNILKVVKNGGFTQYESDCQ